MVDSIRDRAAVDSQSQPDSLELAACLAAIASYRASERDSAGSYAERQKPGTSAWRRASLLEGAGSGMTRSSHWITSHRSGQKLWGTALALLLIVFGFQENKALAQEFEPAYQNVYDENPVPETADKNKTLLASRELASVLDLSGKDAGRPLQITGDQESRRRHFAIRVGIAQGISAVNLVSFDTAQVKDALTGNLVAELKPGSQWKVAPSVLFGGPAIALMPQRNLDRQLIATGDELRTEKKVAFVPSAVPSLSPPLVPAPGSGQAADRATSAQPCAAVPLRAAASPQAVPDAGQNKSLLRLGKIAGGLLIVPENYATGEDQSIFSINGRAYRGALLITANEVNGRRGRSISSFNAINIVDLEDYLLSVLPSEMPASWPLEALKAQAIAARSYVVANLGKYESEGYDVRATIADQVYRGVDWEKESASRAVYETAGIVLKHRGAVVPAFFHSSGGGHTELSQHVWSKPLPYLNAVRDYDHSSPYYLWERRFSTADLEKTLGNPGIGSITAMFPLWRSPSRRVKQMLLVGTRGSTLVTGTDIRKLLKLPGTNFNILPDGNSYVFAGQGFGHGLGMSQYGARTLAEHGYNAGQILKYYYNDVSFGYVFDASAL
ncbi:MAG: SpoIID/LytB domain-containing protein [Candidatus Obscuribacterales bacterium]